MDLLQQNIEAARVAGQAEAAAFMEKVGPPACLHVHLPCPAAAWQLPGPTGTAGCWLCRPPSSSSGKPLQHCMACPKVGPAPRTACLPGAQPPVPLRLTPRHARSLTPQVRTAAGKFAVSAPTTAGLAPAMPAAPGAASSDSPPAIGGISVVDGSAAVAAAERAARRQATTGLIYDSAALRKPAAAPAAPPAPPAQKPAGGSGLILP